MDDQELRDLLGIGRQVDADGYLVQRLLPNGLMAGIVPLTYGRVRIVVQERGFDWSRGYGDGW